MVIIAAQSTFIVGLAGSLAVASWCHGCSVLVGDDAFATTLGMDQAQRNAALVLAGRNKATIAKGAGCWVSGLRNGWTTYAAEY
jgi:hypothetical protein